MNGCILRISIAVFLLVSGCLGQSSPSSDEQSRFLETYRQAENASQTKQWTRATVLWAEVTKDNPVTGVFWLHLADAYYNVQNYRPAIVAYQKAMDLGIDDVRSAIPYNIARCFSRLGDRKLALGWFERAMQLGYRDLQAAQSDKDLGVLSDDPQFQTLVASADVSTMSRDEGWRFDLNLMAREINRRGYAPFHSISHQEFDRRITALDAAIPTLSDMQIIVAMMKLTAAIGDGHTMIYAFSERPEFLRNVPVEFALFQEGLFIIAAESRFSDLLGAQVIQFGDHSEQEVLQGLDAIISRDNENSPKVVGPMRMRNLPLLAALGLILDPTQVAVTVRDLGGNLRTVTLPADSDISSRKLWDGLPENWKRFVDTIPKPLPLYLRNPHKD